MHSPRALDLSPPGGGVNSRHQHSIGGSANPLGPLGPLALPLPPPHMGLSPPHSITPTISHHPDEGGTHEGTVSPPVFQPQPRGGPAPVGGVPVSAAAAFIAAAAAAAAASTSPTSDHENLNHHNQHDTNRPRMKSRRGRGGRGLRSERMAAAIGSGSPRSLSEMSVRGLDLLRYATLAPDGTYRLL